MEFLDIIFNIDQYIPIWIDQYGNWIYAILFLIIFVETGIVLMPFLPGDSLLFVIGSLTGAGHINFWFITLLLTIAAVVGDSFNYWIGNKFGDKIAQKYLKPEHLEKTRIFFEKYGAKTIILARFVPIVRTLAPFTAGISKMNYLTFLKYNLIGGILWVFSLVGAGHLLGALPIVQQNFEIAIYLVIFISLLPGIFEFINAKRQKISEVPNSVSTENELNNIKNNPNINQ